MSMIRKIRLAGALLALLVVLAMAFSASAQSTLTGTVTDPTGAVVPEAKVVAQKADTNIEREAVTTGAGVYSIPDLLPGVYNVLVRKTGFRPVQFVSLSLTIGQTLTLDASLTLSGTSETITVAGNQIAPINTTDAEISNIVQEQQVKSLPLITRNPYELVLLSPGEIQSNTRLGGFSTNGQREINNNFLIDGIDNNDTDVPGGPNGLNALNPDSTQEFRVITNNFAPEFGRNNGAIIDVKSPSGANAFHGDGYWFGRYNALGARDFFNAVGTPMNPYVRNIGGGSFGGPIVKNKTFFFANYEAHRFITTLTNSATVPTDAFKSGIFIDTYIDPVTKLPVNVPIDVSQPSAPGNNNALPYGPDPTVKSILALYPSPTPGAPQPTSYLGTLFYPSASRESDDSFTIRVDHQVSKNNSLFVRYLFDRTTDPNSGHSDILPGNLGAVSLYARTQNFGVGLTSVLSPSLVNELRVGGNRTHLEFDCVGVSTFNGLTSQFQDSYGRGADFTFTPFTGAGITNFGCKPLGDSNGQARYTGTYQPSDSLSWTRGSHTMKFGGEFRDVYSNSFDNFFTRTSFGFDPFNNGIQVLQGIVDPNVLGDATLIDTIGALLGVTTQQTQSQYFNASQVRVPNDKTGFRNKEFGLYAQDSWKVLSNLTVTYGLRYEYYGVPYEAKGNFSSLFQDPTTVAPDPGFVFTILKKGRQQVWRDDYKGFDPRIGVAWDPFKKGKTSVRAGFGLFRDRIYGNLFENARANPPFVQSFSGSIPSPFSLQEATAPDSLSTSAIVPDFSFFGPDVFDPNFKTPYSENWNFGIQHQFGNDLTVELNYVGVHGIHEYRSVDLNPPQPNLVADLLAFCVPGNVNNSGFATSANPSAGTAAGQCSVANVTSANLWVGDLFGTLPFPAVNNRAFASAANGYVSGGVLTKSIARSHYNGLQLNATKRYSHGLQVQAAYTYAHALDDASDPINPASGNRTFPRNSLNLGPEYGNSDFDIRHRLVVNFVYNPAIGRGTAHLSEGVLGRVLEGWEIAGIVSAQTGLPYDIFGVRDTQHTGFSDRATIDDRSILHQKPAGADVTFTGVNINAFNPDTLASTPWGIPSNVTRNQFFGPGMQNWDAVLSKNTAITERVKFLLRFEFYNLFNHPAFGQPGNTLASPGDFGISTSQIGRSDGTTGARQVQFAAKLQF